MARARLPKLRNDSPDLVEPFGNLGNHPVALLTTSWARPGQHVLTKRQNIRNYDFQNYAK